MTSLNFNPSFHQPVFHHASNRTAPSRKMTFAHGARWLCGALLLIWHLSQLSLPPRALAVADQSGTASANAALADDSQDARDSAMKSIKYLAQVMDQYHDRYIVYEDVSSAGNHFHAWGVIADNPALVKINGSSEESTHGNSATAIRCELQRPASGASNWGGFIFMNGTMKRDETSPQLNWGTEPGAGVDLTGATELTFWARGTVGGEQVEFFVGGVGYNGNATSPRLDAPFPDSNPKTAITKTLTPDWQEFSIPLAGKDLSYVLGGFAWVANGSRTVNPNGVVFFLDNIQYKLSEQKSKQRLDEPRFIRSFSTLPMQPPDMRDSNKDDDVDLGVRNAANVYDNALSLLAFLADGSTDSVRRAKLIGDAFVYAFNHDRKGDGIGLRSIYAAGDNSLPPGWSPRGRLGTVPASGYFDEKHGRSEFVELEESRAVDTGNQAWVMIALEALYQHTGNPRYLDTAKQLGGVIRRYRQNMAGRYQGFLRGVDNVDILSPEEIQQGASLNDPNKVRQGASAEHNLDIYAAFSTMFQLTGDPQWQADAQHARKLVEDMWDDQIKCYWSGTANKDDIYKPPVAIYPYVLPVDVQAWSVMAIPDILKLHPEVLACAERNHRKSDHGFSGFDFNNDLLKEVWFEGTGHMAVAYALAGKAEAAAAIRSELRKSQQPTSHQRPNDPKRDPFAVLLGGGNGTPAACHDGLETGFDPPDDPVTGKKIFHYYRRLHVGASAWNVFAQLQVNPYYQGKLSSCNGLGFSYAKNYAVGEKTRSPIAIVTDDFNKDGKPDIAVANIIGTVTVMLGNGIGGFMSVREYAVARCSQGCFVEDVEVGDFNGDMKKDLAVAASGIDFGAGGIGKVVIFPGNGDGSFAEPKLITAGNEPGRVIVGDFNGDGKQDLVVLTRNGNDFLVQALLGDGTGGFGQPMNADFGQGYPHDVAAGDFNNDGKLDVMLADPVSWNVILLPGNGDGKFAAPKRFDAGVQPVALNMRDWNKDGNMDVAVANSGSRSVTVLFGNGIGEFPVNKNFPVIGSGRSVAVSVASADFNKDNKDDLAVAVSDNSVTVLLGNGAYDFGQPMSLVAGSEPTAIISADINCDGRNDLAVANGLSANVSILLNECSATASPVLASAASYSTLRLAPDSIGALFGADMATGMASVPGLPLPTQLAGASVKFRDSFNIERSAPLFFASPTQINLQIPPGTASGLARLTVTSGNGKVSAATAQIDMVAPGIFSADASGQGLPAGYVLRVRADNSRQEEPIGRFDATTGKFVPIPIDLGPASDQVYLVLFGTGWRFCNSSPMVTVSVGGANATVNYAGAQPTLVGVDQLNLLLPRSLVGKGLVTVESSFCGKTANALAIAIK